MNEKRITQKLADGSIVVHLEAVEAFLERCEKLELALEEIKEILQSKQLDEALLDIYDPEREPSSPFIIQTFLALKNAIAKAL